MTTTALTNHLILRRPEGPSRRMGNTNDVAHPSRRALRALLRVRLVRELGDSLVTGPTRTNVNDFRATLIAP